MSEAGILESGVIQVGMDKLGGVQDGFCKGGMMQVGMAKICTRCFAVYKAGMSAVCIGKDGFS